ncbi:MAG: DNA-3-methyladenine glycosylase [Tissierellia bacterium]|nr:DNA-3-methyladenine glycosylase [Tissierellia bacterium]
MILLIKREFFLRNTLEVAKDLLGTVIHRRIDSKTLRVRIVETEGYLGVEDRAAHTFEGVRTPRNEVMYSQGGTMYVYFTYGMHYLMNFVTEEEDNPRGVLIRGVQPLNEWDFISQRRFGKDFVHLNTYQRKNLTNGPAKLTQALGIDLNDNGSNLFREDFYLEKGEKDFHIVTDRRVGIDYAQEAITYPYRFFIKDNPYVSKGILKKL